MTITDPHASAAAGRLTSRPQQRQTWPSASPGVTTIAVSKGRETLLYVPGGYSAAYPAPLAVTLHGAGGDAQYGLALLQPLAEAAGLLLLAPSSSGSTWDVIRGGYGPDVATIDAALAQVFAAYHVDPARIALGGFSDGASYALSLGLMNGALFTHILAFSPGFLAPLRREGTPRVFISHGTQDEVLPIDRCSRRIVPQLEAAGYDLRYDEFDGPHTVPAQVARDALAWFTSAH